MLRALGAFVVQSVPSEAENAHKLVRAAEETRSRSIFFCARCLRELRSRHTGGGAHKRCAAPISRGREGSRELFGVTRRVLADGWFRVTALAPSSRNRERTGGGRATRQAHGEGPPSADDRVCVTSPHNTTRSRTPRSEAKSTRSTVEVDTHAGEVACRAGPFGAARARWRVFSVKGEECHVGCAM